ncbi:hypothetical protein [Flavonifractor sp. An306]|uniref:hypothetical protein n=1 Tax=Flavonifractor sp. An306 TaxID=1965629 RepID=UPI001748B1A9|nr:hypothetical protein [Flavonifractor sp. An306]
MDIAGIIIKNGTNDYTLWLPEIPVDEPLLNQIIEKYANSGCSTRGNAMDILQEVKDVFY